MLSITRQSKTTAIGRRTAGGAWCCRMQNSRACNMAGLFAYADCALERCQTN